MPKILHLADLHIGMENYGRLDPATGMHSRLLDFLARLDEIITYAIETDPVDCVLIVGDIYKSRTPNPTHQREFARRVRRLVEAGLPVLLLTGNHDVPAATGKAHSVEIFGTLEIGGVTIADRLRVHTISTRKGPVQIVAIPWLSRQVLLTKDDLQGLPMSAIEAEMISRVEAWLDQALPRLDPAVPTIVAYHGTLHGATYGAERSIMLGHDLVLPRSVVARDGVDYIALGHIHKHQSIGADPAAVYPGSIERIDFGEEHEAKGFVIADVDKRGASWRFVPVATRPMVTVEVDVREHPDPQQRVLTALAKRNVRDAIVRVLVTCRVDQRSKLDDRSIREALEEQGVHAVAAVAIEAQRTNRDRFPEVADELRKGTTPKRALELYLKVKQMDGTRQAQLLQAYERLYEGADQGGG